MSEDTKHRPPVESFWLILTDICEHTGYYKVVVIAWADVFRVEWFTDYTGCAYMRDGSSKQFVSATICKQNDPYYIIEDCIKDAKRRERGVERVKTAVKKLMEGKDAEALPK